MITKFNNFINENKDFFPTKTEDEINQELLKLDLTDIIYDSILKGYLPGVKLAVEKGVDINDFGALEFAAIEDKMDIVKYLISIGAEINLDFTDTLVQCIENGNTEMTKYLIGLYIEKYEDLSRLKRLAINKDYDELVDYLNKYTES